MNSLLIICWISFLNNYQTLCPPLVLPKNAINCGGCQSRRPGDVCCVRCLPGYQLNGSFKRVCMNNVWSGKQARCIKIVNKCPPIREVTNGSIENSCGNRFIPGCYLTFKCMTGFELDGIQTILCLNSGKWSTNAPKCKAKAVPLKCPQLSSTIRGYWVSRQNGRNGCNGDPGQVCRLRCYRGVLVGPTYVYCNNMTRKWSEPIPECI